MAFKAIFRMTFEYLKNKYSTPMSFHTFIYNTDYMDTRFISLENCSLLHTKILMSHPLVFFTRIPTYDCKCDILVIELDTKEEVRCFKRSQKQAKTVLVAQDALEALDAYLGSGKEGSTFFFYGNFISRIDGESQGKLGTEPSPNFSRSVNSKPVANLENPGSSLDSRVLRKTTWITELIFGCSCNEACKGRNPVHDILPVHEWPIFPNFPNISSGISKEDAVSENDVNNKLKNSGKCKRRDMVYVNDTVNKASLADASLDSPFSIGSEASKNKLSSGIGLKSGCISKPGMDFPLAETKEEDSMVHLLDAEKQVLKVKEDNPFDLSSEPMDQKSCFCTKKFALSSSEPAGPSARRCLSVDPYIIDSMDNAFSTHSWNSVHKGYDDLSLLENIISFPSGHHFFKVGHEKHGVGRSKNIFRHSKRDKSHDLIKKFTGMH